MTQTFVTTKDADNRSEPGAVYEWSHESWGSCDWDNCDGTHVTVILPTGDDWCPDRRASNCGRPDDRTHRCWVRHGPLDRMTVDKNGDTCAAGAGSILTHESKVTDLDGTVHILRASWHGFLRDGVLTT